MDLKPCPFCGGEAEIDKEGKASKGVEAAVICKECGAANFITQWNQRVTPDNKCKTCNGEGGTNKWTGSAWVITKCPDCN